MKFRKYIIVSTFLVASSVQSQHIQFDALEPFIVQLMEDFEVTGLSIGIVTNDSVLYAKGFGTRRINKNWPVDENTLFGIGSISKSFTALTLGILVDEGKIHWDDKVKKHLPYFELYDPYVTDNFTIRDLLTHRSGLGEVSGGTLWYHSKLTRKEIIKRLKYLKPVSGFREKPAYQNVMYLVAGEIVAELAGMPWDDFLEDRLFNKLGMERSTSKSAVRNTEENIAFPHIWDKNFEKIFIEQEKGDNMAPAGFIYSSAKEMMDYMQLLLNQGVYKGERVVGKETISTIFRPQVLYPIQGSVFSNEFTSYGFGWWISPKGNYTLIEHNGGIDGMAAKLFMIKELNIGVVIFTNVSKEPASYLLKAKLLEQLLNDSSLDIYKTVKGYRDRRVSQLPKTREKVQNTSPTLYLDAYTGTYEDRMYGKIHIHRTANGGLGISFAHTPLFTGKMEHWHYDTFKINWSDPRIPDGFATFDFNLNGDILGISLDQENLLDVDFSELEILKQ